MEPLRPVFTQWGEPQVDLFAAFANRRLIKFESPYPDPRAEFTDAMLVSWDNGRGLLYAFPPFKMVPQVLQKVAQSPGVQMILIAPLQETPSWFPELLELSQEGRRSDWQGDRDSSLPAVKSSRVETLRAILVAKGHSQEAAEMMSRSLRESSLHMYESHWARFVSFCRSKRWHVFRVRSHHFSTYMMHLFRDGLLSSTSISHGTSVASVLRHWVYDLAADPNIKLLIRAFRLERLVQCRIMPKWDLHLVLLALMRPPFASECDEQDETSVDVIPLKWRTMKSVPVSIGFSETTFLHSRFECRSRQVCVFERKHPAPTGGISFDGTWVSCQEPATVAGSGVYLRTGYSPSQPVRSGKDALPCQAIKAISTGLTTNQGASADVYPLEPQHQRYHEKSYEQMDREDSRRSLHMSWEGVRPSYSTWGQSLVSIMGLELSGGATWHSVSCILEVVRSLPEFLSTIHGLYRWWNICVGSSAGLTTSRGSRTSSPTTIAYMICMQPLLRRS